MADGSDERESPGKANPCKIRLEADAADVTVIKEKLNEFSRAGLTASARVLAWALHFLGRPYEFESQLARVGADELRVRFISFDCITFIYTLVALARSNSWDAFLRELALLRYAVDNPADIDNDPVEGNFLDFAEESLLTRALQRGVLVDITARSFASTVALSTPLKSHRRWSLGAREQETIFPRYGERDFTYGFIPPEALIDASLERIQDGDVLVFARTRARDLPCLVSHAAVVHKIGEQCYFIHCTRGVTPYTPVQNTPSDAHIHVDGHGSFKQIGVGYGLQYAGDYQSFTFNGLKFFTYVEDQKRTLSDYAAENFRGICVLRVLLPGDIPPGETQATL